IPPEHPFRTLVLCFDGTGDQFDADNSNIVALFSLLKKDDTTKQLCYYQAGVGTYLNPQVASPLMSKVSKTMDMALASDLHAHVMDGYEFLMQNYTTGDRICIFGFSRGAYTARALAGMVHKVGLLPACNHQQVPFAYKMFTRTDAFGWRQSTEFKRCFSIDVDIEFIGVWDTVDSVGLIPRRLPFTASNTAVRTFRHALSLDEHRAKFKANLWNHPSVEATLSSDLHPTPHAHKHKHHADTLSGFENDYETQYCKRRDTPTDVDEVWFAGSHCDVGGGSVPNDTPAALALISLRWMIRECFKTHTGIMFDAMRLRAVGLEPATLYPLVLPRPPHLPVAGVRMQALPRRRVQRKGVKASEDSVRVTAGGGGEGLNVEQHAELRDAACPIYDQLVRAPWWWILEFIPFTQRYQRGDDSWVTVLAFNLARPRFIPKQATKGVRVHRSVKMRMGMAGAGAYVPRAQLTAEPTWID
ncbi:hypothetical protein K439DRAFT_1278554, partial [Ramaria rubella]